MKSLNFVRAFAAFAVLFGTLFFCEFEVSAQSGDEDTFAENIAPLCTYDSSLEYTSPMSTWHLHDGTIDETFTVSGGEEQYLDIIFPEETHPNCMYLKWSELPGEWELLCDFGNGFESVSTNGQYGFVQEYIELPENALSARIRIDVTPGDSGCIKLYELEVYTDGTLPESVHNWCPTPSDADFLVISTHQDDEILFFGGSLAYYTGELKTDTVVMYMTSSYPHRMHEACDGLWISGCRAYPIFAPFPDNLSLDIDIARRAWDEQEVTDYITEVILRLRPQVILTQHTNGEYGHGQHQLTVHCVKNAVITAADESAVSERFPNETAWNTPKLYLHATVDDATMQMMWDELILDSYGGLTSLEVAKKAFSAHVSQESMGHFYVHYDTGDVSDCTLFTLYRSTVGNDILNNDFFENVNRRTGYSEISSDDAEYISSSDNIIAVPRRNLYAISNGEETIYIRWCSYYGETGWYLADSAGALIEPVQSYNLIPSAEAESAAASDSDVSASDTENSEKDIHILIPTAVIIVLLLCGTALVIALIKRK